MQYVFHNIPPMYPLYFFYGAAFLYLGISISVKDMKGSELKLADSLWLLALFGFTHGAHEWLELLPLIQGEYLPAREIFAVKAITVCLVFISFVFLLLFGLRLARSLERGGTRWLNAVPVALIIILALYVSRHGAGTNMQLLRQFDIGARYTFGLGGGTMAAFGLIAYSREVAGMSRFVSNKLFSAGVAFGFYGIFTGVFPSHFVFPFISVPVEVFRGASAIFITYFIIKALNIFDIETRKKIERQSRLIVQAEKLSSLGRLAAGIAHEINNPLTNASLSIQTLRNKLNASGADGKILDKIEAIDRNIDKASSIAQELLQFSRQKEAEEASFNVNAAIGGAITLLRHRMDNISIQQDMPELPNVRGDQGRMEQVFINLLSNSIEAMPGGGNISISSFLKNGSIYIKIVDSGVGISDEHLTRVFDPFFTTKDIGKGTGLGLSICYGIIKQHRGSIDIASSVGKGTTVTVTLPVGEGHEKDPYRG